MAAENDYKLIHILIFVISLFTILFLALIRIYVVYGLSLAWRLIKWIVSKIIKYTIKFFKLTWEYVLRPTWEWIKNASIRVWKFIEFIFGKMIIFFKELFGIGKKVYIKAKDISEAAYVLSKKIAIKAFEIGKDIVIEGINIFEAIWNFIYEKAISIWNSIASAFKTVLSIFGSIKTFLTDSLQTFLNLI